MKLEVSAGEPQPLGATPDAAGVNFSIYSEYATSVELLLFESAQAPRPFHCVVMDPTINHSFHFWHCHVAGIRPGQVYAYRMDGPSDTQVSGARFNRNKVLLDPCARGNTNALWKRADAIGPQDNVETAMRSVVIDVNDYNWEGDRPLGTRDADTIIYELHVGQFTQSASSGCRYPGTFAGVIEKIPYLKDLGVTAVELMPVFDFDEQQVLRNGPDGKPLRNVWGYDPFGHWAPQSSYCISPDLGTHLTEFRDMVKALHRAGIEVILDVVFNHTDEGNEEGPTISFRGQANEAYYHLSPQDRRHYVDYTGVGNTMNANHPVVTKYIIECLEYWAAENHVDGFRFDLASALSRGTDGAEMAVPPAIWGIELSRVLSRRKVIAEPWDAGGIYQVGRFPGERWSEWNGRYRDDVRRFVRGEPGLVSAVATRIAGSADLFAPQRELPANSINFVTSHDGFTLNDLVSYDHKHNEENGEDNRDGSDDNLSWNCGVEGPTGDREVERLRQRQVKNFATILLLSRGIPMFRAGDEVRRTQHGNNNAYCQDHEGVWFDWKLLDQHADVLRFFKHVIRLRKRCSALRRNEFYTGQPNGDRGLPDIAWHGCRLNEAGWDDPESRVLAFTVAGAGDEPDLHVMLNMHSGPLEFEVARVPGRRWLRAVDTSLPSPEDVLEEGEEAPIRGESYLLEARSCAILVSRDIRRGER
ncbi:MAG TPA: glycogen debranching protein GlgX [Candidatus Dormibacteraeota bacterium]